MRLAELAHLLGMVLCTGGGAAEKARGPDERKGPDERPAGGKAVFEKGHRRMQSIGRRADFGIGGGTRRPQAGGTRCADAADK